MRLRRKVRQLELEREILAKAAALYGRSEPYPGEVRIPESEPGQNGPIVLGDRSY
ncbi:hypothetical protein BN2475_1010003 [Paraburkholderia ribeironis]|uniref:Uncharacterized protein n=1 Tax=Paraburkholderia ribeironis TaxID=1247936 RepID=A0A1N7SLX6_9BURK|nr:hypothetical protein BN2475_1010003 [Paraburkholderia ribeironis]